MPETILGLDIGTETIKAVLAIPKGPTEARILAVETVHLEEGVGLEAALKKIADTIRPLISPGVRCIVSLPPSDVMFRHVRLPFHDDHKIKKTLSFELEPLLPVPIEEVVVDYVHLPGQGLLVAICGKERIRKTISAVESHLGKLSAIDISTAALMLPFLEQKTLTGSGILLDIGASSACAAFYENNALIHIRSFTFGGNTITRALAGDLSCDAREAEQIKIAGADQAITNGTLAACREFCTSLANTVEFLRLNDTLKITPEQIVITGGGSLFKPLRDELAKIIGTPATVLDFSSTGRLEIDEKLQGSYLPSIMNTAFATARRALLSHKSFNFRQGEFAPKNIPGNLKKQLQWGAMIAGILLLLAAVDLFLNYQWQASQAADMKKQISVIFKKHYPPPAIMVDPVQQLKTKFAEDKKMYGMDDGASGITVLEVLKDISGLITPALDIVVTHVHFENRNILLKGEARKIDDVTNVKNELSKSKYFKNVTIGTQSLAREGVKVNFDLRIELR